MQDIEKGNKKDKPTTTNKETETATIKSQTKKRSLRSKER